MKKYFRQITYLTLCLFLLNSGLSMAAAYGLSSQSEDGNTRILICTSQGMKWVTLDDIGDTDIPQLPKHDCPLCCVGKGGIDNTLVSNAAVPDVALPLLCNHRGLVATADVLPFYYYQQACPRAPPAV